MKAVLFVGHGSRDQREMKKLVNLIEELKPQLDSELLVETCFLEFETPTIDQGIETCVEKGATDVFVIPIMLLPAGHSKIHIPAAIEEARQKYPHVHLRMEDRLEFMKKFWKFEKSIRGSWRETT